MAQQRQGVIEQAAMLRRLHDAGQLRYVRVEPPVDGLPRQYVVEINGAERWLPGKALPMWVNGFEAGWQAAIAAAHQQLVDTAAELSAS